MSRWMAAMVFLFASVTVHGQDEVRFDLMVGDEAPAPAIGTWVKGGPLGRFEPGRVYVVSFFSSYCRYSVDAVPALSALDRDLPEVTVVGVSIRDRNAKTTVPAFVNKMGDDLAFDVGIQDGTKMDESWMKPAGRNGVPCVMVVDAAGRLAWIGHPRDMDAPVRAIASGEWDLDRAAARYADRVREEAGAWLLPQRTASLTRRLGLAMQDSDIGELIAVYAELVRLDPEHWGPTVASEFPMLVASGESLDEVYALGHVLVDGPIEDNSFALNTIAWTIVDPEAMPERQDLDLALKAAKRAAELTREQEGNILDTLAKVHFDRGELDEAIRYQEQAILYGSAALEEEFTRRLEMFKRAKERGGG
jgi:hypothetical protein